MTFALWHVALAACGCFLFGFIMGVWANVERGEEPIEADAARYMMEGKAQW